MDQNDIASKRACLEQMLETWGNDNSSLQSIAQMIYSSSTFRGSPEDALDLASELKKVASRSILRVSNLWPQED